jgi:hypothetical protein
MVFCRGPNFSPERKGKEEAGGGGQVVSFADVGRKEGGEDSVRCVGGCLFPPPAVKRRYTQSLNSTVHTIS